MGSLQTHPPVVLLLYDYVIIYLHPQVHKLVKHPLIGHLKVGAICYIWHLPYSLVLLSSSEISRFAAMPFPLFMTLTLFSLLAVSIIYGEVRIRTQSFWPLVILHTIGNLVIDALISNAFYQVLPGWDWLLSPGWSSLISILLFSLTGLWLVRGHWE